MSDFGNICKFSDANENFQDLFVFQFIYETLPNRLAATRSYAAFVCHLVTEGTAVLKTDSAQWELHPGDVFFLVPSTPFSLICDDSFKYLYISFVGNRPTELLESVGVTREDPVHPIRERLVDVWFNALKNSNSDNLSLMAKGILYYTLAFIQKKPTEKKYVADKCTDVVSNLREIIDREYANADLSLEYLCETHRYNTKYISRRFREIVGISFSEYLFACRIRHACAMLSETNISVREIASLVGYRDSLYFSKAFKKRLGLTPVEYRSANFKKD
ncbi:MAG: AraC family transcriptional regulator [Oscillospiraceae bacterium]|nr:AraC family transcriptional regulator [Oscillospiraceae bacterium]